MQYATEYDGQTSSSNKTEKKHTNQTAATSSSSSAPSSNSAQHVYANRSVVAAEANMASFAPHKTRVP